MSQPFRISMHSRLFVVSGLLSIRFAVASPPQRLVLHHVKVSILATWTLLSTHKDRATGLPYVENPPVDNVTIALVSATRRPDSVDAVLCDGSAGHQPANGQGDAPDALARLEQGESWEMTHLASVFVPLRPVSPLKVLRQPASKRRRDPAIDAS